MIVTARQIPEGDEAAWHRSWKQTAEQLHAAGAEALCAGRVTSAGLAARRCYDAEAGE